MSWTTPMIFLDWWLLEIALTSVLLSEKTLRDEIPRVCAMQRADRSAMASAIRGDPMKLWLADPRIGSVSEGPSRIQPKPAVFVTLSQAALVLQFIDLSQDASGAAYLVVDWETVGKSLTFLLFPFNWDHSKASLNPLVAVSARDTYLPSNRSMLRAVQILQRTQERMPWVMPEGGRQMTFLNLTIISVKGVSAAMWTTWWRGTEFHTCAAKEQVKKQCSSILSLFHLRSDVSHR